MQTRIKKVCALLTKEKAGAFLVWNREGSGQPGTAWLSGFSGTFSVLLITCKGKFLITDGRYTEQSKKEAKGYALSITSESMSSLQILSSLIQAQSIQKILFDGSVTPYSVIEDLQHKFPEVLFFSRKHILQKLRLVKERQELAILTKTAQIACRAFTRLLPVVRASMTEQDIARRLESFCIEEGAEGFAFPTSVASGKNGALPHAKATDKKVESGELITIDFGVRYRGYVSDMTRTIALGKIPSRLKEMYEAVRMAQERGCKIARAGMTGQMLDAVCRNYLKRKGLGKYFTHSTGHGIGIEVHELPTISLFQNTKLPVGAVITCEPGVYIPGIGGVRIEDSLILTKSGNVNLTESVSKELVVL